MTVEVLWWVLALLLVGVGLAGSVLPALPGAVFVLGGIALAAWIDGFATISGWTVGAVAVLAALALRDRPRGAWIALALVRSEKTEAFEKSLQGFYEVIMKIIDLGMRLAPVGVA